MSTRIRYIKSGEGTYVSTRYIPTTQGEARVVIDPTSKKGVVTVNTTNYEVTGTSLHKIKIAVKNKLIELGAEFVAETRGADEAITD